MILTRCRFRPRESKALEDCVARKGKNKAMPLNGRMAVPIREFIY